MWQLLQLLAHEPEHVLHVGGDGRDLHAGGVFLLVGIHMWRAGFKVKLQVHSGISTLTFNTQATTLATI